MCIKISKFLYLKKGNIHINLLKCQSAFIERKRVKIIKQNIGITSNAKIKNRILNRKIG